MCNLDNTISINHNWNNAFSLHSMWTHLQLELQLVRRELQDCVGMDGWHQQCQVREWRVGIVVSGERHGYKVVSGCVRGEGVRGEGPLQAQTIGYWVVSDCDGLGLLVGYVVVSDCVVVSGYSEGQCRHGLLGVCSICGDVGCASAPLLGGNRCNA